MLVKDLITQLIHLDNLDARIDMASDEEGNSFGDIDRAIGRAKDKDTKSRVYILYPANSELSEDRYHYDTVPNLVK
tara:strand:+ start:1187 stop:1414 length:228 start_codon:yes stop_codon:yes gene_type:complete